MIRFGIKDFKGLLKLQAQISVLCMSFFIKDERTGFSGVQLCSVQYQRCAQCHIAGVCSEGGVQTWSRYFKTYAQGAPRVLQ